MMFFGIIVPAGVLWHLTDGGFDVTRHAERSWRVLNSAIIKSPQTPQVHRDVNIIHTEDGQYVGWRTHQPIALVRSRTLQDFRLRDLHHRITQERRHDCETPNPGHHRDPFGGRRGRVLVL